MDINLLFEQWLSTVPEGAAKNIRESVARGESLTFDAFKWAYAAASREDETATPAQLRDKIGYLQQRLIRQTLGDPVGGLMVPLKGGACD